MVDGPVFIVGMNGSGTTMLADSLGKHPELYVLPIESKIIPYYLLKYGLDDIAGGDSEQITQLASAIGGSKPFWQSNKERDVELSFEELSVCRNLPQIIAAVYKHLADKQGKRRWGDKSPINTQYIEVLAKAFPDARFVHIIRDGRDAAQSFHRRWGYHPIHTIVRWKHLIREGREQGRRLGSERYCEVRYEDLTVKPEEYMRHICEFLHLSFTSDVLRSSMHYMDRSTVNVSGGRIVVNSEKWRTYFDANAVRELESHGGAMMHDLGYATSINGDRDPSSAMMLYFRWYGHYKFTRSHFREYGLRAFPMYLRQLIAAARQWRTEKR